MVSAVDTFNDADPDWETTAVGRKFNYKCASRFPRSPPSASADFIPSPPPDGYGKLNAGKFVEFAETWKLVKPQAWLETEIQSLVTPKSAGEFITEAGISHTYTVSASALKEANFERLEHVTVQVWIEHARRGDVEVELTSPKGITSVLARTRRGDMAKTGFRGWKFMSMKHWCVSLSSFDEKRTC